MKLTVELAQAIRQWAFSHTYEVLAGAAHRAGRLVPKPGDKTRDYILGRCKDHEIFLAQRGIAIAEQAVERLDAEAKAFIEGNKTPGAPATEDFGVLKKKLEQEKPVDEPVPFQVPPDGVLWSLCNGRVAAECAKEKDTAERALALKHLAERPERWLPRTTPLYVAAVRRLARDYPNFQSVIDHVARHLSLLRLGRSALHLPPLLLAGPPGVGKTRFAAALARALSMQLRVHSLADASAAWILTGHSRTWQNGTPGVMARFVAECPTGKAPLLLLDELDKASGSYRYPVDAALLGLLEPETAREFRDENLDLLMDLTPVTYLLTANRLDRIRPEILSRMTVLHVQAPTAAQMPAIVRSVDGAIREEYPHLDRAFEPLGAETVAACAVNSPRELRRLLLEGYARVAEREAGRSEGLELGPGDVMAQEYQLRQPGPKVIPLGLNGPWRMQ